MKIIFNEPYLGDEESTGKAKHMLQRAVNEFGSGGM